MPAVGPRAVIVTAVLPSPPSSGGHKRTLRLIEAIARAGATPHLLSTDRGEPGAAEELRARGWIVETLAEPPATPLARLSQHLRRRPSPYLRSVAARLRETAAQAAFVQFEHAQSAYYWEAIGGARSVLSLHNVDSQMLASVMRGSRGLARIRMANRALAMRSVERRSVPRADAVLTVCARDRHHFERLSRCVLEVPNGVDEEFFAVPPALPENEEVLFFGHFGYAPNALGLARFLRDGWPLLAGARPAARLTVAGKGVPASLARELDRHERVRRLGFVEDLPALLDRSRMVLVPLWQGGGTRFKVLEALASWRPLVSTPQGVEELGVAHRRHALLAEHPGGLAAAASEVLGDPALSRSLSQAGRELAERYRWPRVLAPAERLYADWLAGPAGRPSA